MKQEIVPFPVLFPAISCIRQKTLRVWVSNYLYNYKFTLVWEPEPCWATANFSINVSIQWWCAKCSDPKCILAKLLHLKTFIRFSWILLDKCNWGKRLMCQCSIFIFFKASFNNCKCKACYLHWQYTLLFFDAMQCVHNKLVSVGPANSHISIIQWLIGMNCPPVLTSLDLTMRWKAPSKTRVFIL